MGKPPYPRVSVGAGSTAVPFPRETTHDLKCGCESGHSPGAVGGQHESTPLADAPESPILSSLRLALSLGGAGLGASGVAARALALATVRDASVAGFDSGMTTARSLERQPRAPGRLPRLPTGVPKVPWQVAVPIEGAFPPGKPPTIGDVPKHSTFLVPIPLELRVENGIWTQVRDVSGGIDVAVGRRFVWVHGKSRIWKVDVTTAQPLGFEGEWLGTRISASHSALGQPVEEGVWVVTNDWVLYRGNGTALKVMPGVTVADVAADEVTLPAKTDTVLLDVLTVTLTGDLRALQAAAGQYSWVKLGLEQERAVRIAIARRGQGKAKVAGLSPIWFVRDDDQVANFVEPSKGLGPTPGGAWDIGVGRAETWVVGGFESPDPGERGNVLWRMDYESELGHWDRISPGWGVAVDVDPEGNAWVLDSDGKLWVRGLRTLGVAANARGAPRKDQTWNDYFAALGEVGSEAVHAARDAGVGGTIYLTGWDDVPPGADTTLLEATLARTPGLDVLFSLSPIFTTRQRLPESVLKTPGVIETIAGKLTVVNWTHPALLSAYLSTVDQLAAVPGFKKRVRYFSIGNEVDSYLGDLTAALQPTQPAKAIEVWDKYAAFCQAVAPEVRKRLPNAKVGVCWRYEAIAGSPDFWHKMSATCDVFIATLYARTSDDQPATPEVYRQLFPGPVLQMAAAAGKPLVLQEVGMPTPVLFQAESSQAKEKLLLALQLTQQAAFVDYLFEQWQLAGGRIRFISWFPFYDYFYDPKLKVALSVPSDLKSPIIVTSSSPGVPKELAPGVPFIGLGNLLAPFFFGPFRPDKPTQEPDANSKDLEYFLNQSANGGVHAAFCQFLSSCGLLRSDGTAKPALDKFRQWAEKLRTQAQ